MLRERVGAGLIGLAAVSSAALLFTGSFVVFACGVLLPLTTALAAFSSGE